MKQLTSSGQTVTDTYDTDAWGANGSSSGSTVNPFCFGGQFAYFTDPDSGLLRLGVRYLDPANGRFTQRDPVPAYSLLYTYADSRASTSSDPSGRLREGPINYPFGLPDPRAEPSYGVCVQKCLRALFSLGPLVWRVIQGGVAGYSGWSVGPLVAPAAGVSGAAAGGALAGAAFVGTVVLNPLFWCLGWCWVLGSGGPYPDPGEPPPLDPPVTPPPPPGVPHPGMEEPPIGYEVNTPVRVVDEIEYQRRQDW